ncbi:MAG: hypothetical protein MJ212_05425 [Alphaproteobacteria bacterium]|nr:hypothetical protein [Alphaproteobacteria bacterium]
MKIRFFNILKIICTLLCVVLLVSACSGDSASSGGDAKTKLADVSDGQDIVQVAEAHRTCWTGDLLKMFYNDLGTTSLSVYNKLTGEDLLGLMVVVFSVWMAFQILRHVATPSPESPGEFWTKVMRKGALCLVCGILASSTDNIMYALNTFVFPVYITLLELASSILQMTAKMDTIDMLQVIGGQDFCEVYAHHITDAGCTIADSSNIKFTDQSFPEEPLQLMTCMTCAVGDRLNIGYEVALRAMILPQLTPALLGIFLLVIFTIVKICFVLYIIDSVFRMDMMIVIMPFLILFYPFEQTRKWTATGFKLILNSAGIMLCLVVIVATTILAMQNVLGDQSIGIDFGDFSTYKNFGVAPAALMFLGFVILKATKMAVSMSDSVTGGGADAKIQKKVAAVVGTIIRGIIALFSMGSSEAAGATMEAVQKSAEIAEKIEKIRAKIEKMKADIQKAMGKEQ